MVIHPKEKVSIEGGLLLRHSLPLELGCELEQSFSPLQLTLQLRTPVDFVPEGSPVAEEVILKLREGSHSHLLHQRLGEVLMAIERLLVELSGIQIGRWRRNVRNWHQSKTVSIIIASRV
jgi:hypothetical protein